MPAVNWPPEDFGLARRAQWQGERNRYRAYVCNDEAAVIAALEEETAHWAGLSRSSYRLPA